MSERPRRAARPEAAELRVTPVSVAVPASPAQEHHLGDRLAAFVDGELDHGARERVQAHLATCSTCLTEAEEARQLKSRLREVLPPDPSPVFMSRLLSIAAPEAGDDGDGDGPSSGHPSAGGTRGVRSLFGGSGSGFGSGFGSGGGLGGGGLRGSSFGSGALGADHPVPGVDPRARRERSSRTLREVREPRDSGNTRNGGESSREEPRPIAARLRSGVGGGLLPSQPLAGVLAAAAAPMGTQRGRRLVFAAAGAFSVAAVTLSTALTGVSASSDAPADVSPLSGTGNYAPAGSQLALENLHSNAGAAQAVTHRTMTGHPLSDPSVVPAGRLMP